MIRVLVVDDSRLMRELLTNALIADGDISVVGAAADPFEAREMIRATNPDVVSLDIEMPRMSGLEFLRRIMRQRPMPVVMVAGNITADTETTLAALELGAVDFVSKPRSRAAWESFAGVLRYKVRAAAQVRFYRSPAPGAAAPPPPSPRAGATSTATGTTGKTGTTGTTGTVGTVDKTGTAGRSGRRSRGAGPPCDLIAIGASTGGVTAIARLLDGLPASMPPLVIAQHMPQGFTARFAERLARTTGRDIAEASDGAQLHPGMIRLAPGNRHLRVARSGGQLICRIGDDAPVGNHRPSVDALYASVAAACGKRAIGVILTRMGSDGAKGLLQMRNAGALTYGEAEISCTIYGMPKAAMQIGAVTGEYQIDALATHLASQITGESAAARARG